MWLARCPDFPHLTGNQIKSYARLTIPEATICCCHPSVLQLYHPLLTASPWLISPLWCHSTPECLKQRLWIILGEKLEKVKAMPSTSSVFNWNNFLWTIYLWLLGLPQEPTEDTGAHFGNDCPCSLTHERTSCSMKPPVPRHQFAPEKWLCFLPPGIQEEHLILFGWKQAESGWRRRTSWLTDRAWSGSMPSLEWAKRYKELTVFWTDPCF